jgi:hypothetical protein
MNVRYLTDVVDSFVVFRAAKRPSYRCRNHRQGRFKPIAPHSVAIPLSEGFRFGLDIRQIALVGF